jgi:outer membrane protein OmpA-like peptidoglycan-associated protein
MALFLGAAAFAGLLASGALASTSVTTGSSSTTIGPESDESEENPDVVPDTADMDAAEAEIRQQLRDARMEIRRRGGQLIVNMGADILFTFDSYEVSNEGVAATRALARVLQRHRRATVEVNGHTDTRGTPQYNDVLSDNRARAVAQIMVENGVDVSRITANGYGESRLAVQTPDETKEIKNRRVEIVIQMPQRRMGPRRPHRRRGGGG